MRIRSSLLREVTVARYDRLRQAMDFSPPYQREGGVWNPQVRSRLIDSLINGFDIPKIYLEQATHRRISDSGRTVMYAVVDGKQRLSAISEFLDGNLTLPEDFRFYEDDGVDAKGLNYAQLISMYPGLAQRFRDYELPMINIDTDDIDLIEEMFQRLNAATALNHAERRNAVSGPTRNSVNRLAEHRLLKVLSPIRSSRYKYRELAAKFLAIEHQIASVGRVQGTKANTLYDLFVATKSESDRPPRITAATMDSYETHVRIVLDSMSKNFVDDDRLLSSIGTVVVYYIAFRNSLFASLVERETLVRFETLRRLSARMGEDDPEYARRANARLREYNVLVQSTNDGSALTRRAEILSAFVSGFETGDELRSLDSLGDGSPAAEEPSEDF